MKAAVARIIAFILTSGRDMREALSGEGEKKEKERRRAGCAVQKKRNRRPHFTTSSGNLFSTVLAVREVKSGKTSSVYGRVSKA